MVHNKQTYEYEFARLARFAGDGDDGSDGVGSEGIVDGFLVSSGLEVDAQGQLHAANDVFGHSNSLVDLLVVVVDFVMFGIFGEFDVWWFALELELSVDGHVGRPLVVTAVSDQVEVDVAVKKNLLLNELFLI